jgi:hypothetical protein
MEELLTVIISALVGAVVSYLGAVVKNMLDMRTKIDENLRATRIQVYKVLWEKTGLLPQYPRATDVTYEKLDKLSHEFRDWYFTEGGMFLSAEARRAYGNAQEALVRVTNSGGTGKVSSEDYERVRIECHRLREELTNDLLSRRRTFLTS